MKGHVVPIVRVIFSTVALLCAAAAAAGQGSPSKIEIRMGDRVVTNRPETEGAIRVLFIGNSLTYWNQCPGFWSSWTRRVLPRGSSPTSSAEAG